jgi:hypothetical protein
MFAGSCSPRSRSEFVSEPAKVGGAEAEEQIFIPDTLLAIVRSGETPLWFELGVDGPVLIPGPAEALEEPFAPWPQARHVAGLAVDGRGRLIMAVNRDGFLAWETQEGGLGLYRIPQREAWDPYTAASLFIYRETPAVLLYRNEFFPKNGVEWPDNPAVRVWGLGADFLAMKEIDIPAFAVLPQAEGWDVDTLSLGNDGLWYYRGLRRDSEIRYLRTRDLSVPGEVSSVEGFRNAMSPCTEEDMPPPIRAVLEEAEHLAEEGLLPAAALVAAVVSPDFPTQRYFAAHLDISGEQEVLELAGFYRSPDTAAVVFPNGEGIFAGPGASTPKEFVLPVLPEGFAYTRIGFAGRVLIASWEEQQDWRIGAAGFMALDGPWL